MPAADAHEVREVPPPAWERFAVTATGATPFSSLPWLACAAAATAGRVRLLGAFHRGQLVAGVAGCESGRGWRRRLATPDLLPHTGFLYRPAASERPAHVESERAGATRALVSYLQSAYPRVLLSHPPELADVREFQWAGWGVVPRYTYWIDLPADRDSVWGRFERRTRTAVRKAERAGYRVEATTDVEELRRLYGCVYGDEGDAPVPGSVVEAMAGRALDEGLAHGFRAVSPAGDTASVVLFASGPQRLYAWVAGADPTHRDAGATSLLYWKVLADTTCSSFDFVGANLPSLALFKRGFGGGVVPYYATVGCRSRLLRAAAVARRLLRPSPA